jgi:hypothetical protein
MSTVPATTPIPANPAPREAPRRREDDRPKVAEHPRERDAPRPDPDSGRGRHVDTSA